MNVGDHDKGVNFCMPLANGKFWAARWRTPSVWSGWILSRDFCCASSVQSPKVNYKIYIRLKIIIKYIPPITRSVIVTRNSLIQNLRYVISHMPSSNGSLFIAIKLKTKYTFHTVAILLTL